MTILHVDANSAYLSWTAVALLEKGYELDIRTVPSVIAGDPANRHGIILARSGPAKKLGIKTADSLMEARKKCPDILVYPPSYDLYLSYSDCMYELLCEYSPKVQRYSIDECFVDYEPLRDAPYTAEEAAEQIRKRMKKELGFTVSIGISANKVLAKMAGELKKPDAVSTIYPKEIAEKLWPLPVTELFMVGRATTKKLEKMNIHTIGQLAKCDVSLLRAVMKSHGQLVWDYANGIDFSKVIPNKEIPQKSIGNSNTFAYDVEEREDALHLLLALCERVGLRLRSHGCRAGLVSIHIKTASFFHYSHQEKLPVYYSSTDDIFRVVTRLFDQCWKGEAIRQMGVSVSNLIPEGEVQMNFLEGAGMAQRERLESAVDQVRKRFGERAIIRGCFADGSVAPIQGGVNEGNYIMMGGYGE